ncbi:MAG: hypothetical protein ABSH23_02730 [Steroidobacteraceae bacterium]|jgi:hypothetical protein
MLDRFKTLLTLVLPLLPLPLLCACGSSANHVGSHFGLSQHHAASNAAPSGSPEDADMVAAVSMTGSDATIGMKFRLDARPVVGTPLQIELALVPSANSGITHIHGSLQAGEGLQLQSQRTFDINSPQDGVTLRQEVTVVPQQDGVLSLSATLLIDFDNGSLARTYSIPLIAAGHPS